MPWTFAKAARSADLGKVFWRAPLVANPFEPLAKVVNHRANKGEGVDRLDPPHDRSSASGSDR